MADPPRDESGRVTPHDDRQSVPDDSFVLRSIPPMHLKQNQDGPGRYLSSGAFSPSSKQHDPYQGMSVDVGALLVEAGIPESDRMLPGHEALVKIRSGDLRDIDCWIGPDPRIPDNPYHGEVWRGAKLRKKIKRKAIWIIRPEDVLENLAD